MLEIRKAGDRGSTRLPWLKSRHSFSFGGYKNPQEMGFSDLRVINDDRVAPGKGFSRHGHRDVEILTYVLQGTLAHRDTLGNSAKIKVGEFQLISAGSGIEHSELNTSSTQPVHFLQIWLTPQASRTKPSYQQKQFSVDQHRGKLQLIASKEGASGSLKVRQDARIYVGRFGAGDSVSLPISSRRQVYVHVIDGRLQVNGVRLAQGDGLKLADTRKLAISAPADAQVMVFDLRSVTEKSSKPKTAGLCVTRACGSRKR
ncbi:pirin family protein [Pseudomonas fluorescens]|uniref:pirin family protein n=1 Tax=Pseudomonas fluorescens TaxID=294 RepID=UPI000CA176CA|nr:pirin family protein [Pseudomonas fluorescens]AUM69474.1 quercetin 2,3-dioxygenase [Pseudomonas fluorescens]